MRPEVTTTAMRPWTKKCAIRSGQISVISSVQKNSLTARQAERQTMPPQKPAMPLQAYSETDGASETDMSGVDFAFLDSGTGGIPYMLALKEKMPSARCVYLGDTAHFPYGEKSPDEVTRSAAATIRLIVEKWHPKAIVIACNTISVTSLDDLRALFPETPIVGTVPAIKLAANVTKNKRIGLLATNATVNHPYCARLTRDFASDCTVFSRGDPDLISFIEHELFTATPKQKRAAVTPAVEFFSAHDCDTIILGCTHFTHVADEIAAVAGNKVRVVDSREGVANQAIRVEAEKMASCENSPQDARSTQRAFTKEENHRGLFPSERDYSRDIPADKTFFVTACTPADTAEYSTLCKGYCIPWGGKISL